MNILSFKKSEMALTVILIVIIVVVFLGWLINIGSRECRSNADCGSGFYCGSDFACHQIPTVEKTVVKNNLIVPSIIIGIAIIIAAIVLKWEKIPFRKKSQVDTSKENIQNNPLKMP